MLCMFQNSTPTNLGSIFSTLFLRGPCGPMAKACQGAAVFNCEPISLPTRLKTWSLQFRECKKTKQPWSTSSRNTQPRTTSTNNLCADCWRRLRRIPGFRAASKAQTRVAADQRTFGVKVPTTRLTGSQCVSSGSETKGYLMPKTTYGRPYAI